MNKLYVLTGPAGVGKSTISRIIAENHEKTALIEGDLIYEQVVGGHVSAWKPGNHLDIFWKICLDTIDTYLKGGYDVIFNYIITSENLEKIKTRFANYKIKFVVLLVDEKTILERDKTRPEDCQMNERCLVLLNNFKKADYGRDFTLDTTNLTINETVEKIEKSDKFDI